MRERLLKIMEERGIKSAQLAAKAGLSTSTVADILSGKVNELNLGVSKVVKIADALGVSVEYLYGMPEPEQIQNYNEQLLLSCFRDLNEIGRARALSYIEDLLKIEGYRKSGGTV